MTEPETHWAPLDKLTLGITLVLAALCMGFPIFYYLSVRKTDAHTAMACLLPIAVFLGCALFSIRSYQVKDGVLRIQRTLWCTKISLAGLESAEFRPNIMSRSWRLFGVGGLFGWIGWFRNSQLGTYRAWVTHREKTVVVKIAGKTYVLSPLDPEKLVEEIRAARA